MREAIRILTKMEMNDYLLKRGVISKDLHQRVNKQLADALTRLFPQNIMEKDEMR